MSDPLRVDLFAEDRAHEAFVRALAGRIAREEQVSITMQTRSARGGHPRALGELRSWQTLLEKDALPAGAPDLVVVVIDGNCGSSQGKREEIREATHSLLEERVVAGCPDPHVERWFLADPDSFHAVVGYRPVLGSEKCEREYYKKLLVDAIHEAHQPTTLGGIEFAGELVEAMDLFRAGKGDASLRAFVRDLRSGLRHARC